MRLMREMREDGRRTACEDRAGVQYGGVALVGWLKEDQGLGTCLRRR
jgi:hypothetical protein